MVHNTSTGSHWGLLPPLQRVKEGKMAARKASKKEMSSGTKKISRSGAGPNMVNYFILSQRRKCFIKSYQASIKTTSSISYLRIEKNIKCLSGPICRIIGETQYIKTFPTILCCCHTFVTIQRGCMKLAQHFISFKWKP